nr:hypothetical protein [uncultured Actinoplanes sp.]
MTTSDTSSRPSRAAQLARRVTTTLLAWIAAYAVVNVVVLLGGPALAATSSAVRTLVISGTLVILMINVLMPVIVGVVGRLFDPKAFPRAATTTRHRGDDDLDGMRSPGTVTISAAPGRARRADPARGGVLLRER